MPVKKNSLDPRSLPGIMARGKTLYPGGSPNPTGKNQHIKNAAIARLRKRRHR